MVNESNYREGIKEYALHLVLKKSEVGGAD
jgi:hypothetical protein